MEQRNAEWERIDDPKHSRSVEQVQSGVAVQAHAVACSLSRTPCCRKSEGCAACTQPYMGQLARTPGG